MKGKLFLIPNFISGNDFDRNFPAQNKELISRLKVFIVESPKPARLLLKMAGVKTPFEGITFLDLNEHTKSADVEALTKTLEEGNDAGLISDAGYPAIADPGEKLVKACHRKGIQVVPLPGLSSIFLALAASGLNAEHFTFHGYLPIKSEARVEKIKELEVETFKTGYSQIFIETPYRNHHLYNDLLLHLEPNIFLGLGVSIGSEDEKIKTQRISAWKNIEVSLNDKPVVFIIGRE